MKALLFLFTALAVSIGVTAQTEPLAPDEQQLENLQRSGDESLLENDSQLQHLLALQRHPLDMNAVTADELRSLGIPDALQQEAFFGYRKLLGPFVSKYELQAIPGWSAQLVRQVWPYLAVQPGDPAGAGWRTVLRRGDQFFLLRAGQVLERAKGYNRPDSGQSGYYTGSPAALLLRYQYQFKKKLQYGFLAEKDPGEPWFRGRRQTGFDFYSFHIFWQGAGLLKTLAAGDFIINMGQGLVLWQGMDFGKSSQVLQVKKEAPVLQPYHSAGEINFQRGLAIRLGRGNWSALLFVSHRRMDASRDADSTSGTMVIRSLQSSGYHRTPSELATRAVLKRFTAGAGLSFSRKKFHLGLNWVTERFNTPFLPVAEMYKAFAPRGSIFNNLSADFSFTHRNWHLFGELAANEIKKTGLLGGLLISLAPEASMSLLYRRFEPGYWAFNASVFSNATAPGNEEGFYAGLELRPAPAWRISAYADFFRFPWLKYRVNRPSAGSEYLFDALYTPSKTLSLDIRFRHETNPVNYNAATLVLSPTRDQARRSLRSHLTVGLSQTVMLQHRVEIQWFDWHGPAAEQGWLSYVDLRVKSPHRKFDGSVRLQYFDTEGFNSRIYAFESEVLYAYSVPVFYGRGLHTYILINLNILKRLKISIRGSRTAYFDKTLIGSGLDEISGNKKILLKLQAIYRF